MSEPAPEPTKNEIDWGAVIHSIAGIISLVLGGLMYWYPWALNGFAGLMILSAGTAIYISWRDDAWVPGHWLAMLPVIGIIIGFGFSEWGFTFAYVTLWIAFLHFVIRGIQAMKDSAKD